MVVLWCRQCGALMGMKEPLTDWSQEHGLCLACAKAVIPLPPVVKEELEKKSSGEGNPS